MKSKSCGLAEADGHKRGFKLMFAVGKNMKRCVSEWNLFLASLNLP